jgi:superfamily II DNA/RNA helicase
VIPHIDLAKVSTFVVDDLESMIGMGFMEELETFCPQTAQYIVSINTGSQLVNYFIQKYVKILKFVSDKAEVYENFTSF